MKRGFFSLLDPNVFVIFSYFPFYCILGFSTKWRYANLEYLSKIHKYIENPNLSVHLSWMVNVCLLYIDPSLLFQKNVQVRQKWALTLRVFDPACADCTAGVSPAERRGVKPAGLSDWIGSYGSSWDFGYSMHHLKNGQILFLYLWG